MKSDERYIGGNLFTHMDAIEKAILKGAIEDADHQPGKAAEALGISRATLRWKLIKHGLAERTPKIKAISGGE